MIPSLSVKNEFFSSYRSISLFRAGGLERGIVSEKEPKNFFLLGLAEQKLRGCVCFLEMHWKINSYFKGKMNPNGNELAFKNFRLEIRNF